MGNLVMSRMNHLKERPQNFHSFPLEMPSTFVEIQNLVSDGFLLVGSLQILSEIILHLILRKLLSRRC
jgi:hypothetical protein